MYQNLNEVRILNNVLLSEAQKFILTKLLLPDATPVTNYSSISAGKNLVANRDILVKLGLLTLGENEADITETGIAALKNEGLASDTGELTDLGQRYAYAPDLEAVEKISAEFKAPDQTPTSDNNQQSEPPAPGSEGTPPMGIANQSDQEAKPSFEAWSMVTDFEEEFTKKSFLNKYKKS